MGKEKKEKRKSLAEEDDEGVDKGLEWDEKVSKVGPIAKPLASRKLTKKLYKIVKKAHNQKSIRKGIRDVQKSVRKGERGVIIMAGDTSPIEVICHMPLVCEEKGIPYCYIPSRDDLGAACGSRRPTCMVLVKPHTEYEDLFNTINTSVKSLPLPI